MLKKNLAKVIGWGQVVVVYLNTVLDGNGGVFPTTKQGWLTVAASLLMGGGVHIASETSAGHPNGVPK